MLTNEKHKSVWLFIDDFWCGLFNFIFNFEYQQINRKRHTKKKKTKKK